MAIIHDPEETRAIAIAGMSLGYALAGVLKRMGVLDPAAIEGAFEAALSSVENSFTPDDHSAAVARRFLDRMDEQLAAHVKPIGAPEPERLRPRLRTPAVAIKKTSNTTHGERRVAGGKTNRHQTAGQGPGGVAPR